MALVGDVSNDGSVGEESLDPGSRGGGRLRGSGRVGGPGSEHNPGIPFRGARAQSQLDRTGGVDGVDGAVFAQPEVSGTVDGGVQPAAVDCRRPDSREAALEAEAKSHPRGRVPTECHSVDRQAGSGREGRTLDPMGETVEGSIGPPGAADQTT